MKRLPTYLRLGGAGLLFCICATVAVGQAAPEPVADIEALRAELEPVAPLYPTVGPLRLRFTLVNTSDEVVTIPLTTQCEETAGVALPLELALGTSAQPALTVCFESEEPAALQPPQTSGRPESDIRPLKLAPHGTIGAEIDLRMYNQAVRYTGVYRVEWRPLGGRLETVAAEFRVEPRKDVIIVTDQGKMTFSLRYDDAPRNVENFVSLVKDGFYNGLTFHSIVPGFVIQGGCPKGDGRGIRPDGKLIPAEFHDIPVETGTLMMSRKLSDANSASCQFVIALARVEGLDGIFTVIGQATDESSLRTLARLTALPTDRDDRPLTPVIIRSINLVDVEGEQTVRLQMRDYRRTEAPEAESRGETESQRTP